MRRQLTVLAATAALALAGCSGGSEEAAPSSATPAPPTTTPSASATPTPSATSDGPLYLALGDSLAAGYQPGGAELRDSAYPALAAARIGQDGPDLDVENISCSGESTTTFLDGTKCDFDAGSQMAQAEQVLAEHAGDVALVTIDLGANDLLRCVRSGFTVDADCVDDGLATVDEQLPDILQRLRDAAGPDVPVLALGYYNPWLAASYLGQGQSELDVAKEAFTSLDTAIEDAADASGATSVGLDAAFKLDDDSPTTFGGREVPTNVAQICTLTYLCTAFDIHLTGEGAAVVARVVSDAAEKAGVA